VAVHYPDAELVMCAATRALNIGGVDFVGRELPRQHGTAVIWNRVGGRDPLALMQVRVFAPTPDVAVGVARRLAGALPGVVRLGFGIFRVSQETGVTDLGSVPEPLRQMVYEIGLSPERLV